MRIVVGGMTRLLGSYEYFAKIIYGGQESATQARTAELIAGWSMVGSAVGLLPSPALLISG